MLSSAKIAEMATSPRATIRLFRKLYEFKNAKPVISAEPGLDAEGVGFFNECLSTASMIFEYGAGGTTLKAAQAGVSVLSVETDRRYADTVNAALNAAGAKESSVLYANVGITTDWGTPIDMSPTPSNRRRWSDYVSRPWTAPERKDRWPDVVLVDGRFRVACAAEAALRSLEANRTTTILVDDFFDRPQYWGVSYVCRIEKVGGRMAKLTLKPSATAAQARELREAFQSDCR